MNLTDLDADALSRAIHAKDVSCREVMRATLDRIATVNPALNAIVSLQDEADLLRQADARDAMLARGESHGLDARHAAGDQGCRGDEGDPETLGSPLLADHVPHHDALMVERMKAAGCIVDRQDEHARVRPRLAHLQRGVRRHAQRVRPHEVGGRQQRRRRGRAGDAHAAGRRRQRLHGEPAQPCGMERRLRLQAEPGPRAALARRRRLGRAAQHRRPDGAHRARRRRVARRAGGLGCARAAVDREQGVVRGGLDDFDPRGVRIGWLGDLDGYLPMEPGIVELCARALAKIEDVGGSRRAGRRSGSLPSASGRPGSSGAAGASPRASLRI